MKSFDELSLKEIVNEVKDGCILGVPADYSGVPMEFTKRLIKKGIKDLKLCMLRKKYKEKQKMTLCRLQKLFGQNL